MFERVISRKNRSQLIRFILVGMLNTGFAYAIYVILLLVGLNYQMANLGALVLGVLFSFRTQGHIVFNNANWRLFGKYLVAWAAIYLINITIIGGLLNFGINAYIGGILALPTTAAMSFVVQKYFVFEQPCKVRKLADTKPLDQ